ncbi:MAG: hypothetical protein RL423_85, partial [Bacteroidota bacterium]
QNIINTFLKGLTIKDLSLQFRYNAYSGETVHPIPG